jgi:thiamine biosynthesis lipoprotein
MATHVFETMGTVVSVAFRAEPADAQTLERVEREFTEWDARYSLYRPNSELSRIVAGELRLVEASEHLRSTYELALEWRSVTGGAFTAHRPDGAVDLSGVVKATAVRAAGGILELSNSGDWLINAGGDVFASRAEPPWIVGIVDPADRAHLLTSVALTGSRVACATSGTAERGDHIWGKSSAHFVQATVIADDIVTADVLATAIIAGGTEALELATRSWSIDVITVDRDGEIRMTPGAIEAMHRASSEG